MFPSFIFSRRESVELVLILLKTLGRDFPGGPVVKTSPSNAGSAGFDP